MRIFEEQPPSSVSPELSEYLIRLITDLNNVLSTIAIETIYSEPESPIDGMIIYTDGIQWNPGNGAGVYIYKNGWTKFNTT